MNHAKRNPGIPKRPNPQKNAKVVLGDRAKREREYLAKRIITLAQQGERNAALLRDRMLKELLQVGEG